jgi:hypothetical protein
MPENAKATWANRALKAIFLIGSPCAAWTAAEPTPLSKNDVLQQQGSLWVRRYLSNQFADDRWPLRS